MKLKYSKKFRKELRKLSSKKQLKVKQVIEIFKKNPRDPRLRNHKLHGKIKDRRSISVDSDLRIVFREENNYLLVLFLQIGNHKQVY